MRNRAGTARRGLAAWLPALLLAVGATLALPRVAGAETITFGSPLNVPATLDTAKDLSYEGTNVALPGSVFHINHDGADTALWNVSMPAGSPTVPAGGQVLSFQLEGCARRPAGAPAPLTQIHFQDLTPQSGGGVTISESSGAFEIPVCEVAGAGSSTVTSYTPSNFCVSAGDYVDFNDEGGFVGGEYGLPPYPAGVPYQVIGAVAGASMDSFIRDNGTNNGTTISTSDRTAHDGFAANAEEELMLQATLGTGADASSSCPGGTKGAAPPVSSYAAKPPAPTLIVKHQTDGINHRRLAAVALFCNPTSGCRGSLTLTALVGHGAGRTVHTSFSLPGHATTHVSVRVPSALIALARKRPAGVPMRLQATVAGSSFTKTVVLRIF